MDTLTLDYYARRERTERARADTASDPAAARVHRELAERYAAQLHAAAPAAR